MIAVWIFAALSAAVIAAALFLGWRLARIRASRDPNDEAGA